MRTDVGIGRHLRLTLLVAAVGLAPASTAHAHLMSPRNATIHVVGTSAYSVVWLPASALVDIDSDGDGLVSQPEVERGQAQLVERLKARWTLRDGAEQAKTVRLDLILQPPDNAPPAAANRSDAVVMLHHAQFTHTPARIELETDLFGAVGVEPELTVSASGEHGAEKVTLHPPHARHTFFAGTATAGHVESRRGTDAAQWIAIAALMLALGGAYHKKSTVPAVESPIS